MSKYTETWNGIKITVTDNSPEIMAALENAKKRALWSIGDTAEKYAKRDTPVDTGRLRNSISHAEKGDSVYIGTNVEYGPFIELGSRGRKAHHMLQKAATQHSDEYRQIAKDSLENA